MASKEQPGVDEALYSRQLYVLGGRAMELMTQSSVLILGMGALGVEIAKNVILTGVKQVTIHDFKTATKKDVGENFYIREDDVGRNRAEACLGRLAELNPYVTVKLHTKAPDEVDALRWLSKYQCIVATECSLEDQIKMNDYCRSLPTPCKFIAADVYGVFGSLFCDFGDNFCVVDDNGEEPNEFFISKISKDENGLVRTLEDKIHGLQDGDVVTFKEVQGMEEVNGKEFSINVKSHCLFTIGDVGKFSDYITGGICQEIKKPKTIHHIRLSQLISEPKILDVDFSRNGLDAHLLHQTYHKLLLNNTSNSTEKVIENAKEFCQSEAEKLNYKMTDETLIEKLVACHEGCLIPLCAAFGGIAAQEVLKALTGKYTPLSQQLYIDARELVSSETASAVKEDRYASLRSCVGEKLLEKIAKLKLFMIGCGAIGCEMLKNLALIGASSAESGVTTITDNDLIEKSNLNRQFLFRSHHIQKPKSATAAASAKEINSDVNIVADQHKVCPQSEDRYTNEFFGNQDIVINALDNVEARRYVDSRCVTTQRPLLESGTMGPKGHVQVIVPFQSESYASQSDPVDNDVPYCTLKSFPNVIEHCIQWGRDKFESSFAQKPALHNKVWTQNSLSDVIERADNGAVIEGASRVAKMAASRPHSLTDCILLARKKFDKYFDHRARSLLHHFPLDTRLADGTPFWQSPKRPPSPQTFDSKNSLHVDFLQACARLYADINKIPHTKGDLKEEILLELISDVKLPEFRPSSKRIETDESVTKPDQETPLEGDDLALIGKRLRDASHTHGDESVVSPMLPLEFEKDDAENGHMSFITAVSNLRAQMYGIETANELKTKRIAGNIVPAIATTTAAIAGLVTIELLKLVKDCPLQEYRNCFLNLALPSMLLAEVGEAPKETLRFDIAIELIYRTCCLSNGVTFTLWDRWEIQGSPATTMSQFIGLVQEKYNVQTTMVVQGNKMIYVMFMPGHNKRLPKTMSSLVKSTKGCPYVDLVVSYAPATDGEDDQMGPPLRYYLS